MRDYPAAHSMDTTWFAVDEDGNVGVFDSGENGAVPKDAASGGGAAAASFDLFPLHAMLAARVLPTRERSNKIAPTLRRKSRAVIVIEATEPKGGYRDAVRSDVEASLGASVTVLREAGPRIVVTNDEISPEVFDMLVANDDVVEFLDEMDLYEVIEDDVGLFQFHSDSYAAGKGPGAYKVATVPAAPIRIDELPAAAAEPIKAFRLPVHFAEKPQLELADHLTDEQVMMYSDGVTLRGEEKALAPAYVSPPPRKTNLVRLAVVVVIAAIAVWLVSRR